MAYSRVTAQKQCKPYQVSLWLTPVLLPRNNVSLIRCLCGSLPCYCPETMYVSSGDVVPYSRFTAQTQCKPHQVTLWLTSLLLPTHNVCSKNLNCVYRPLVVFRGYPPPREATCHLTTYARPNCSRMNPSETELTDRQIGLNMNYSIIFT